MAAPPSPPHSPVTFYERPSNPPTATTAVPLSHLGHLRGSLLQRRPEAPPHRGAAGRRGSGARVRPGSARAPHSPGARPHRPPASCGGGERKSRCEESVRHADERGREAARWAACPGTAAAAERWHVPGGEAGREAVQVVWAHLLRLHVGHLWGERSRRVSQGSGAVGAREERPFPADRTLLDTGLGFGPRDRDRDRDRHGGMHRRGCRCSSRSW